MGGPSMFSYPSSRSHLRHARGYIWICLLVLVFGTMLLMDNGVSPRDLAHLPRAHRPKHTTTTPKQAALPLAAPSVDVKVAPHTPLPAAPVVGKPTEIKEKPIIAPKELEPATEYNFGNSTNPLYAFEILIVYKTGATALWKRIPMHLSTTLSRKELTPNIILYSDAPDKVLGHTVHDCLANSSDSLKASPDFDLYRRIPQAREGNLYLEGAGMEGDFYIPGGWRLDKYKFVPLIAHAAKEYRNRNIKWFVYMEDDNYYFWNNLYTYLGTFDPSQPLLIGSPAARLGEDFAHGGSGFAISAGAMKKTFWADEDIPSKWEDYAKERCCGDQVLSHVMLEMGVQRYRGEADGWFGLQSLPDYRIGFGDWNWCSPLMNIHKTHQADLSRLDGFEQEFLRKNPNTILRYSHIFDSEIYPHLKAKRTEWDNYANAKVLTSEGVEKLNPPLTEEEKRSKPWFSEAACLKACEDWDQCLSWKYRDDSCGLSHTAARGMKIDDGTRVDSGWMLERIEKLRGKSCQ